MRPMKKGLTFLLVFCVMLNTFGNSVLATENGLGRVVSGETVSSGETETSTDADNIADPSMDSGNTDNSDDPDMSNENIDVNEDANSDETGDSESTDALESDRDTETNDQDEESDEESGTKSEEETDEEISDEEVPDEEIDDELTKEEVSEIAKYNVTDEEITREVDAESDYTLIISDGTITGFTGNLPANLTIPDTVDGQTVLAIGSSAFVRNTSLEVVVIPDSVTEIGQYAFSGCTNLAQVTLSKKLKNLGFQAFENCDALSTVEIPKSLDRANRPFEDCDKLATASFEEGTVKVAGSLFGSCPGIKEITIPSTVTVIEGSAFHNCKNLAKVTISDGVTEIGSSAFASCISLEEIKIPDSVTEIGQYAFSGCTSLAQVTLSKKLKNLGFQAFENCDALSTVEIPKSLDSTNRPFEGCDKLATASFEEGAVKVAGSLFGSCPGIKEITIPSTVTVIEGSAFHNCKNLAKVTISDGVTEIGSSAFGSCTRLEELKIPDSVTEIGQYAFSGCTSLAQVTLSKKLKNLGFQAFENCDALSTVEIPKSLDRANRPFEGCDKLATASFEEGAVKVAGSLFGSCPGIKEITIPSTVTVIEGSAFSNCKNLAKVTISDGVTEIGSSAFASCISLEEIKIPDSVTEIGQYAFSGCTSLAQVTLSKKLKNLGFHAFENCDALSTVEIPKSLDSTNRPFEGCDKLATASFEEGTTKVAGSLFGSCPRLKEITIPSPVTVIESNAFSNCKNLEKVSLPYSLKDIQSNAFANCSLLTEIYIPRATTTIANNAFNNPANLTIYGIVGSYAQEYANLIGAKFVGREIKATEVSLNKAELELEVDDTAALIPKVTPSDFTDEVSWESSKSYIASISDTGLVTAKAAGTATIKVTVGAVSASCKVTVTSPDIPGGDDDSEEDTERDEVLPEDRPEDGKIPEGLWIAGVAEDGYAYTGSAIKPEIRVYDHTTLLQEKTDYTISYKNNTKAFVTTGVSDLTKAPTITVTGKGNYSGKDTATFSILPIDISGNAGEQVLIEADDITIAANGKEQKPAPTLLWNGKQLKSKTDYTFTYHEGTYETTGVDGGSSGDNIKDTRALDSVKEAGSYYIKLTGVGNFTGARRIKLTVLSAPTDTASLKPISKATVTKIPSQSYQTQYKDGGVIPEVTVKYGSEMLIPGTHYTVTYSGNTKVGTAYAVIRGKEEGGYSGIKRVSFKITGIAVKKATVKGLSGQTFIYSGVDIEPSLALSVKVNGQERVMVPGTDYKVTWQNNRNAGTATALITGLGGYTGTVKKTFKIKTFDVAANTGERFTAVLENGSVPYAKGGAKPTLKVTFTKEDKTIQSLVEGKDYTLSYQNNTAVNDGSNANKVPTVTIKGKGSFSGTYTTKLTYKITAQDIGKLTLSAADKTYQNKQNSYAAKVTITDLNGKTLKAGTDYDKAFTYVYKYDTTLDNGTVRKAGTAVEKDDIVPAGAIIVVTVSGKGNYIESIKGEYRITRASISGASVSVPVQIYTGRAIKLEKEQITVKVKGKKLETDQYEIVPGSYKNNIKKGTASVTIKGIDNYGGTKTVKFKVGAKGFLWWWRT